MTFGIKSNLPSYNSKYLYAGSSALPSVTSFEQKQCLSSSLPQHSPESVHTQILYYSQNHIKFITKTEEKLGFIFQRTGGSVNDKIEIECGRIWMS